ncbi:pancreatic triacylglycerol lipase-like isoform X2 [Ischnura elegans]|uniref:pancreatic triacylglycerol lipase-like isoform X2 n=1 Tax=Ischnura elegans TaxID=197161 RepID=UPI001ED87D20|nr:pancreatic triacylglycerol lipase-like isoform X2 [Ischnura elegans]
MAILLCSLVVSLVAVTSAAIGLPTLPTAIPAALKDAIPTGVQDVIPTGIPDVLPESVAEILQNMPSMDDFHNAITANGSIELPQVMYFPDDNGDPKPGKIFGNETAGPVNETDVFFKLHTRNGPKDGELIVVRDIQSLRRSHFNASLPTYFVTHGFLQSSEGKSVQTIKDKYLGFHECNVIVIDWYAYTKNWLYFVVRLQLPDVAQIVADCADFLVKEGGADPSRMHLIGHSLGAHVVGIAGKRFLSSVGKKVGRITGLDPAGPLFTVLDPSRRIDKDDADFVDVIHTCAWWLGMSAAIGHADFYPNGGYLRQPGCSYDFGQEERIT